MNTINWQEIITNVVNTLLPILVMWLVGVVAALIAKVSPIVAEKIHASFTSDQIAQAKAIAGVAVTYAEQVWNRPDVQAAFKSKKAIAESYITNALFSHGIHISAHDLEAILESAVYKEINQGKLLEIKGDSIQMSPSTVETVPVQAMGTPPQGDVASREVVTAPPGEEGHSLTPPQ